MYELSVRKLRECCKMFNFKIVEETPEYVVIREEGHTLDFEFPRTQYFQSAYIRKPDLRLCVGSYLIRTIPLIDKIARKCYV